MSSRSKQRCAPCFEWYIQRVKVKQVKTVPGGFSEVGTTLVRVVEMPDGYKLAAGETKLPDSAAVVDWTHETDFQGEQ